MLYFQHICKNRYLGINPVMEAVVHRHHNRIPIRQIVCDVYTEGRIAAVLSVYCVPCVGNRCGFPTLIYGILPAGVPIRYLSQNFTFSLYHQMRILFPFLCIFSFLKGQSGKQNRYRTSYTAQEYL